MDPRASQPLLAVEAESFCQSLEQFSIQEIGSPSWARQHEKVEKLNMQAVVNASAQEHEFVKEFLISESKYPMVIRDLLATELWRDKVFFTMLEMSYEPKITFPLYMVMYHEATLVNLLETTLYYQESCEACEDSILDLIDYCHRKILHLTISRQDDDYDRNEDTQSGEQAASSASGPNMKELLEQDKMLQFDIAVKALSLIRYICDHLSSIPLSCASRILNTHDYPVLLVELLQHNPLSRYKDGKLQKYVDNKWQTLDESDRFKLTKAEGQIWLILYKLLMDPDCQRKYEFNSFRKNSLLKLRSYLNETLLDQIPVLGSMMTYLEHLSMMEPPNAKQELILEQVPEVRDTLLKENSGKWKKIAQYQIKHFFEPSKAVMQEQAKRWADTYNLDILENLISEPPRCAVCHEEATKRCSRCQNEWYCRRECQVKAWKAHKPACDILFNSLTQTEAVVAVNQ